MNRICIPLNPPKFAIAVVGADAVAAADVLVVGIVQFVPVVHELRARFRVAPVLVHVQPDRWHVGAAPPVNPRALTSTTLIKGVKKRVRGKRKGQVSLSLFLSRNELTIKTGL